MEERTTLDINDIMDVMPHRYPFLLVDRIEELEEDRVVGIKNVTINEPFFIGHFPGHPIMPGVLIIESMAQAGGFMLLKKVDDPKSKLIYFLGVDKVKFRKAVLPGDTLRHVLTLDSFKRGICIMTAKSYVGEKLVCEGILKAMLVDK